MNTSKIKQEGYVILTPTLCQGTVMCHSEVIDGICHPWVFETAKDAWKEIADSKIEELRQFIDDERELDELSFEAEDFVGAYTEYADGTFVITGQDDDNTIINETSLEDWRKSL